ncbi:hypothetical protein [Sorangium sp. So ce1151]|uniref:hypothetical protein n=1 Tax=Sorangium sp. So ce1151 TaxID=3133332 RepID=UPI003F62511A
MHRKRAAGASARAESAGLDRGALRAAGNAGADRVWADAGADHLCADRVWADAGADRVWADAGADDDPGARRGGAARHLEIRRVRPAQIRARVLLREGRQLRRGRSRLSLSAAGGVHLVGHHPPQGGVQALRRRPLAVGGRGVARAGRPAVPDHVDHRCFGRARRDGRGRQALPVPPLILRASPFHGLAGPSLLREGRRGPPVRSCAPACYAPPLR